MGKVTTLEGEPLATLVASASSGDPHAEAGAIVFTAEGGVLHADAAAVELLGRVDPTRAANPWSLVQGHLDGAPSDADGSTRLLALHGHRCVRLQVRWLRHPSGPLLLCVASLVPTGTLSGFEAEADLVGLTRREREVCLLAMRGRRNHDIALELGCAPSTVRLHLMSVFRKAGVRSRAELAGRFLGHAV